MDIDSALQAIYGNKQLRIDPFTYMSPVFAFTAAATQSGNIPIQADADFVLITTQYFVNVAAAAQTNATRSLFNGTLLITDTGSGKQLSNAPVPVEDLFGNGQFPFVWPQPYMFRANSNIALQVTQIETTTQSLYLAFCGIKVYVLG